MGFYIYICIYIYMCIYIYSWLSKKETTMGLWIGFLETAKLSGRFISLLNQSRSAHDPSDSTSKGLGV